MDNKASCEKNSFHFDCLHVATLEVKWFDIFFTYSYDSPKNICMIKFQEIPSSCNFCLMHLKMENFNILFVKYSQGSLKTK